MTYEPTDLVQVYFKALQYSQTIIVPLQETVTGKVLILQGIDQLNKHINLNEAVDDWKKKTTSQKSWKTFKVHFTKVVKKNQKHSETLK